MSFLLDDDAKVGSFWGRRRTMGEMVVDKL